MIVILGHTAAGKTTLAAHVAKALGAAVVSADSRQVYRGMTIGTGKDLADYVVDGFQVPYFLVDIADAGEKYNVFEFQRDFYAVYDQLNSEGQELVLCGGTGMYLESVLRSYQMLKVPVNEALRASLEGKSLAELGEMLAAYKTMHNKSDVDTSKRAIRAIEIAEYQKEHKLEAEAREIESKIFGLSYERDARRSRITTRLKHRLENEGLIEEAESLVAAGVSYEALEYYGLEYKYLSYYLVGDLSYDEMFTQLNTAIHRFAKRQMTYFRSMEKKGVNIEWIKGEWAFEKKLEFVLRG